MPANLEKSFRTLWSDWLRIFILLLRNVHVILSVHFKVSLMIKKKKLAKIDILLSVKKKIPGIFNCKAYYMNASQISGMFHGLETSGPHNNPKEENCLLGIKI